jgi:MFS family permease
MSATPIESGGPPPVAAKPSVGKPAWVALGVLWFIYVLNFLDRQLLSILAKPIQDALHITDSQLGLLGGLYFAFFYCFIAIPVGWLADRTNRVWVVSIACGIWSAATIACGLSRNFGQLAVSRMTWASARRAACRRPTPSSPTISRPAVAAWRWASTIWDRRSARRWASPSAPRSPPPSAGVTPSSPSAWSA